MNAVRRIGLTVTLTLAWTAGHCQATDQDTYATPLYGTSKPEPIDPNYGLPSFGMPGADLPRQRTMAPDPAKAPDLATGSGTATARDPDTAIDLYKRAQRYPLSKGIGKGSERSDATETPLYTTNEGASSDVPVRIRRSKPYLTDIPANSDP
jgi:hypothetical protein